MTKDEIKSKICDILNDCTNTEEIGKALYETAKEFNCINDFVDSCTYNELYDAIEYSKVYDEIYGSAFEDGREEGYADGEDNAKMEYESQIESLNKELEMSNMCLFDLSDDDRHQKLCDLLDVSMYYDSDLLEKKIDMLLNSIKKSSYYKKS